MLQHAMKEKSFCLLVHVISGHLVIQAYDVNVQCNADFSVSFQARPCWYGAMLTSCPNCQHVFELVPCCNQSRALAAMAGGGLISVPSPMSMALQANDSSKATTSSPQPSPSVPLSFTWTLGSWSPPSASAAPAAPQTSHSDADLARLAAAVQTLRTSGWYYEGLTWQQSAELLRDSEPGTFLVRDSSDPRFLFSLSVQTERGPTSVRLHYVHGLFRLDAEARLASVMPVFDCIVRLVQHYVDVTKNRASGGVTTDKEQVRKLSFPCLSEVVLTLRSDHGHFLGS